MSYPRDLYPSSPSPAAPIRALILDGLVSLIAEFILETIDCAGCRDDGYPCPAHQGDAELAEDCRAAYLHLAATGAN